jgi:hypothetical protein
MRYANRYSMESYGCLAKYQPSTFQFFNDVTGLEKRITRTHFELPAKGSGRAGFGSWMTQPQFHKPVYLLSTRSFNSFPHLKKGSFLGLI